MRTIKFRAWDKVNGKFIWLFSESVLGNIFSQSHSDEPQDVRQGRLFNRSDSEYELSQFTGLYDRNGKGIYEADIDQYGRVCTYYRGSFIMEHKTNPSYAYLGDCEHIEIIGNLYQNPELLNN